MRSTDTFVLRGASRQEVERQLLSHQAEPDADWTSYRLPVISAGSESVQLGATVRLTQQGPDVAVEATFHQGGLPSKSSQEWFRFRLVDARRLLRQVLGAPAEPIDDVASGGAISLAEAGQPQASGQAEDPSPPAALPGASSVRLRQRGFGLVACGALVGVINALIAASTRSPLGAGLGFIGVLVVLSIGAYVGARGVRKARAEREHGYTVDMHIGVASRDVVYDQR